MAQPTTEEIDTLQGHRAALLDSLYNLSKQNVHQPISLRDAAETIGLKDYQQALAVASYLDAKGLFNLSGGGWGGRMTVSGIDLVEKWRSPGFLRDSKQAAQSASIVVHGNVVGGIQANSPNSMQMVSTSLTHLDESFTKLRECVEQSLADELDKEDASAALDLLRKLAQKPKSPEVFARAKEKLELVERTINTAAGLSKIAAPYIALLASHFA